MIKLKNLSKTYPNDNFALKNINLEIKTGEVFGIIGRSGAGKSTLVRCINLLERPSSGKVYIGEQELTQLNTAQLRQQRQKIGMIFQHFNLLDSRTALENILLTLEVSGWNKDKAKTRALELLNLVGLTKLGSHYPKQLSGGQKQRVAIARALANNPKILLCDEATSALDPETTINVLTLLKKLQKELNLTIVLITHEMEVIKNICHRAAVIEKGKIVELADTIELFTNPKTEASKSLTKTVMHMELPPSIKRTIKNNNKSNKHPVLRLIFVGKQVEVPVLAIITEKFKVEANIIQATTELIADTALGVTICSLQGNKSSTEKALSYVKQQGIQQEVLGYV